MSEKSIPDQVIDEFIDSLNKSKEFSESRLKELKEMLTRSKPLNRSELLKFLLSEE